jgi:hypothetical protein
MLGQTTLEEFGQEPLGGILVATGPALVEVSAHGVRGAKVEPTLLVPQELGADVLAGHGASRP